jgi:hypothetical protein
MIIYKSRFLTRGEVWFDDEPDRVRVDWIHYRQRSQPVPRSRWKVFSTRLIDLEKSPAELLAEMEPAAVRKLREAEEKDRTRWERCHPLEPRLLDTIEEMWNRYAVAQGTPKLDRAWYEPLLAAGVLDISVARVPAGEPLSFHVVYVEGRRAQQLLAVAPFSASSNIPLRNAVNRANHLIHWNNFLSLKERGIHTFDFGGWYPGTTDIRLLGLNAFKKSLGGRVVQEYNCDRIHSLRGWVVLTTARLLHGPNRSEPEPAPQPEKAAHATAPDEKISSAV